MVRHLGMTPAEALVSATRYPAEFFGMQDSLGTIIAGKLADLVLLDADPLVDIRNTTKISGVVANGRYLDRGALDALLTATQHVTCADRGSDSVSRDVRHGSEN
jgi:adenine deaminase